MYVYVYVEYIKTHFNTKISHQNYKLDVFLYHRCIDIDSALERLWLQ